MPEPHAQGAPPGRGGLPPAPPGVGEPSDPGAPVVVRIGDVVLGDLGNARVDARLIAWLLGREGDAAAQLALGGVDAAALAAAFPELRAVPAGGVVAFDDRPVEDIEVLRAVAARGGRVAAWIAERGA